MRRRHMRWAVLALLALSPLLASCTDKASATESAEPSELIEVEGSEVPQVVLTERAAERLGIEMTAVTGEGAAMVIPAAVVYDPTGATWAYTSPEPLTFERTPIEITTISGDDVLLAGGLDPTTEVVTLGTAELYGVEQGIGS